MSEGRDVPDGTPSAAGGTCGVLTPSLVDRYANGSLDEVTAWSVEAHLPACPQCRSFLTDLLDRARLERNRAIVLVRAVLPTPSRTDRVANRCGIPSHTWRLLAVTPSLRLSWLVGVALVLVAALGAARLELLAQLPGHPLPQLANGWPITLVSFLVLAPLLPLAGIAVAFHRRFDPAAELAVAAPISGMRLLGIRAVAVIVTALVPTTVAVLLVPGSGWLPLLVVLPALAVSTGAVALATVAGASVAAVTTGVGWVALVAGLGWGAGSPGLAYGTTAQLASLGVVTVACGLLALRRHTAEALLTH